jgi:glycosyltransferase involved in cell wall biosynthesis
MHLSIIIPTKNESKNIPRLLLSIFNNRDFDAESIEVIVVDNPGTSDDTRSQVKKFKLAKLYIKGPERSAQRNFGASKSAGEYLYFIDADMEFTSNLLGDILTNLKEDRMLVIKERIVGKSLYCKAINLEKQIYDGNDKLSAARIFPKKAFDFVKGYNEKMISGEDWDLDKRIAKSGLETVHLQNHILHHEEDIGLKISIKKKVYYAKHLKNYKFGIQLEVNPFYRYYVLFSKPLLILQHPLLFIYLLYIKTLQFLVGTLAYYNLFGFKRSK